MRICLAGLILTGLMLALAACSPQTAPKPTATATSPTVPAKPEDKSPSVADFVARSQPADWRPLDPENTLYIDFPGKGRVIIEMAPAFAPNHVANVKALSREGYFKDGAVTRVQDNYVTQWAQAADPERAPKVGVKTLKGEFTQPINAALPFAALADPDTYAPQVGFVDGFATARDDTAMWLTHCYGAVGVGRDNDEDSGGGTELYAIIGTPPRHLDKNITVLGRVVQGMEILASLPRGTGEIGFYETPSEYVRYADIKVAADVPEKDRTNLEVMKTDSAIFADMVNSRRWRNDDFYHRPPGRIGLCNVTAPVRVVGAK